MTKLDKVVHKFHKDDGTIAWAVGAWDSFHNQYTRPLDAEERSLTGCHTEFGSLSYMPRYKTREAAEKRARELYQID